MLLLYPIVLVSASVLFLSFTFHYASTLSAAASDIDFCLSFIYIPLCFYFIVYPFHLFRKFHLFTFHYASTLSSVPTALTGNTELIYIPLCFYFIPHLSGSRSSTGIHLHSTMLLLYHVCAPDCPGFRYHLHSTMLLLYHIIDIKFLFFIFYLHSTMLLLYPGKVSADQGAENAFTFHYASTLSLGLPPVPLHPEYIYIPLCFYFIPSPFSPSTFFNTVILFVYPLSA